MHVGVSGSSIAPLMGDRDAKRQRVLKFVGLAGSGRGLLRLLDAVKDDPEILSDKVSRRHIADAEVDLFEKIGKVIKLPDLDGGAPFEWAVASLPKLLAHFVEKSEKYRDLLASVYAENGCAPNRPWNLILAEDELTPGAVLRQDNQRKALAHYASFLEIPVAMRTSIAAWMPLAFLRSTQIKKTLGGTSGTQRVLLRDYFVGPDSIRSKGVVLPIGPANSPVWIFVTLSRILCDEAAEMAFWGCRGFSGWRKLARHGWGRPKGL